MMDQQMHDELARQQDERSEIEAAEMAMHDTEEEWENGGWERYYLGDLSRAPRVRRWQQQASQLREDVSYLTSKARLVEASEEELDAYYEREAEKEYWRTVGPDYDDVQLEAAAAGGGEWFDHECGWQSDAEGVAL